MYAGVEGEGIVWNFLVTVSAMPSLFLLYDYRLIQVRQDCAEWTNTEKLNIGGFIGLNLYAAIPPHATAFDSGS